MLTTWTSVSLEQFIPLVTNVNNGVLLGTRIYHYSTKAIECKERTHSTFKFNNLDFNAWERITFFLSSLHETEKAIFKVRNFLCFAYCGCFEVYYMHAFPVLLLGLFFIVIILKCGT